MQRRIHSSTRTLAHALAGAALVGALFAGAASAQTAIALEGPPTFDGARAAYERIHWDQAYAAFTVLADQGDPEAARIVLQMWRHGPRLYGRPFAANAQQVARWSRVWRCGSEGAPDRACQQALQPP